MIARYQKFFEAVQRPDYYISQINELLIAKKEWILEIARKKSTYKLSAVLSAILRKYRIKVRYEDSEGDFFGIADNPMTLPDKFNTIIIKINQESLYMVMDDSKFDMFVKGFIQVLGHELVHRLQFFKKVSIENQEYLIQKSQESKEGYFFSPQELMSYAWETIEEFRFLGYSTEDILRTMSREDKRLGFPPRQLPFVYQHYLGIFGIRNAEARNRLHKYMYEYLVNDDSDYDDLPVEGK